jgi:hypothetical protein
MVAWWPFPRSSNAVASSSGGGASSSAASSSTDADAVPFSRGLLETQSYEDRVSGKERNYGDSGVAQSEIDRMRDMEKIRRHKDARAGVMNTESIDSLVDRYEDAFRAADAHMKQREANHSMLPMYDYKNDRRYHQWQEDQKSVRERLQIHFLDTVIDESLTCFVYYLRVCTTAGLCYGVGRTAYLYRTMDKTYAKLNGVTLSKIAFNEITTSVAKSAGVALAGSAGVPVGDSLTGLFRSLYNGDIVRPDRTWWNIVGAGTTSGLCAGAAYVAMHHKDLTLWGMRAMLGGFTTTGVLGGFYLGYFIYRPFAMQRTHPLYDPYWHPWQTRSLRADGPTQVRGRYV